MTIGLISKSFVQNSLTMKTIFTFCLVATALLLTSCNNSTSETTPPPPDTASTPPSTDVSITTDSKCDGCDCPTTACEMPGDNIVPVAKAIDWVQNWEALLDQYAKKTAEKYPEACLSRSFDETMVRNIIKNAKIAKDSVIRLYLCQKSPLYKAELIPDLLMVAGTPCTDIYDCSNCKEDPANGGCILVADTGGTTSIDSCWAKNYIATYWVNMSRTKQPAGVDSCVQAYAFSMDSIINIMDRSEGDQLVFNFTMHPKDLNSDSSATNPWMIDLVIGQKIVEGSAVDFLDFAEPCPTLCATKSSLYLAKD